MTNKENVKLIGLKCYSLSNTDRNILRYLSVSIFCVVLSKAKAWGHVAVRGSCLSYVLGTDHGYSSAFWDSGRILP